MYSGSDGCHSACSFSTSSLSFPLAAAQIPLWSRLQGTTPPGPGWPCHTGGFGGAEERAALRNPALTALWGAEGPTCPLQTPTHLFVLHVLTDVFLNKTRVSCVKRHEDCRSIPWVALQLRCHPCSPQAHGVVQNLGHLPSQRTEKTKARVTFQWCKWIWKHRWNLG